MIKVEIRNLEIVKANIAGMARPEVVRSLERDRAQAARRQSAHRD
jgi:hypothetical protein